MVTRNMEKEDGKTLQYKIWVIIMIYKCRPIYCYWQMYMEIFTPGTMRYINMMILITFYQHQHWHAKHA